MKTVPALLLLLLTLLLLYAGSRALLYADPGYRAALQSQAQAEAHKKWVEAQREEAEMEAWKKTAEFRAQTYAIAIAALLALAVAAVFGGLMFGAAFAAKWLSRPHLFYPDKAGIFPAIADPGVNIVNFNEPGAQRLAVMMKEATSKRLSAPALGRITAALFTTPHTPDLLAAPAAPEAIQPDEVLLPRSVSIYDAERPAQIGLAIGVSSDGPFSLPLLNLPLVLIAGLPGSGKTNLLASLFWSLAAWSESNVRLAVIDTKQVDFGHIDPNLQALWRPVAVDIPTGAELIADVLAETEDRFEKLRAAGLRSAWQKDANLDGRMRPLILFIDEASDWTLSREPMEQILQIARKGRAAGVLIVLAAHTPRADVLPARLTSLAGPRIAFRVSTRHASQVIIGEPGAELIDPDLPGRCIVAYKTRTTVQAYDAGVGTSDEFDQRLAALPRRATGQADTPKRDTIIDITPSITPADPRGGDISAMPVSPGPLSDEQKEIVLRTYRSTKSIRATQRFLFPQSGPGGYWFYAVQAVIREAYPESF